MKKHLVSVLIALFYVCVTLISYQTPAFATPGGPCCKNPANAYVAGKGCYATPGDINDPKKQPDPNLYMCAKNELCDSTQVNAICVVPATPRPDNCLSPGGSPQPDTVDTAIGCISVTPGDLISLALKIGVGTGSGIAFLLIIYGSFKVMRSQGNPEGINSGKETITSAVIGLVFIILSVAVLQVIGFDILGLGAYGLGAR